MTCGLAIQNSDIDIVVTHPELPAYQLFESVHLIAKKLFKDVEAVRTARVPKVTLKDGESGIKADIVFNNSSSLEGSEVLG